MSSQFIAQKIEADTNIVCFFNTELYLNPCKVTVSNIFLRKVEYERTVLKT